MVIWIQNIDNVAYCGRHWRVSWPKDKENKDVGDGGQKEWMQDVATVYKKKNTEYFISILNA